MQKFRITMQAEIIVEFDENSEDFKDLWKGYKEAIDRGANYESFAETIASHVSRYGTKDHIEGIGYLKYNGENQNVWSDEEYKEQEGYVNIEVDTDLNNMVEFESYYVENLLD